MSKTAKKNLTDNNGRRKLKGKCYRDGQSLKFYLTRLESESIINLLNLWFILKQIVSCGNKVKVTNKK